MHTREDEPDKDMVLRFAIACLGHPARMSKLSMWYTKGQGAACGDEISTSHPSASKQPA